MAALRKFSYELAAGLFFALSLLFMAIVRQYYTRTMPEVVDPSSGRTIAVLVNYGKTVYVTPLERGILWGSYLVLIVAVVTAIAVYMTRTARNKPTSSSG